MREWSRLSTENSIHIRLECWEYWTIGRKSILFNLLDRSNTCCCASEKYLICYEELTLVHTSLDHLISKMSCNADHTRSSDTLENILSNPRSNNSTATNQKYIHTASFWEFASWVHHQCLIKSSLDCFTLGKSARNITTRDLGAQWKWCIALSYPRADRCTHPISCKVVTKLDTIDEKIFLDLMKSWANIEITRVDERPNIDRSRWLVHLYKFDQSRSYKFWCDLIPKIVCTARESLCMIIESEKECVSFISNCHAYSSKCGSTIMKCMSRNRDIRILEREERSTEICVWEECLCHREGR